MDEEPPLNNSKFSTFKSSSFIKIFILIFLSIQISNSFSLNMETNKDDDGNFSTLINKSNKNSNFHYSRLNKDISKFGKVNISIYRANNFDDSKEEKISTNYNHYIWDNIDNYNNNSNNCTEPAINDFPKDGLTRQERRQGWILIHLLLVFYGCWLLAIICDNYFVPCIESFCNTSEIDIDVIGATLMAAATSSPELFVNCVGTFLTKGDIGVGTVVGSAVFNVLAVPACCGLFVRKSFYIDWWPVSRDSLMYFISVLELIFILYDGKIMWYEAFMLILSYCIYIFGICCYNDTLSNNFHKFILKWNRKSRIFVRIPETTPLLNSTKNNDFEINGDNKIYYESTSLTNNIDDSTNNNPWIRTDQNIIVYLIRWPITFILWITIPDCKKWPNLRYFTLILCIIWIGIASYLVSFFTTVIGDTFDIPDSVMGITILAAGMSIPEAVSSVIVTKQGHGIIGISNSIGSNTFDILLSLGIPWFIKTALIQKSNEENWIIINSNGLIYSVSSLIITLLTFYITLASNKFKLNRNIGIICLLMYICFITLASIIEMNYFFEVNLPICDH